MRARARGALRPGPVLALLILLQAAGIAWVAGRSWWYRDDFSWMLQAKQGGFTWDVLSRTVFNSFVPLFRAMYAPVVGVGGSAYWPVVVFDVLLGALITWQTWRLVRLWTGASLLGAVVVGVGATSALWVPTVLWPADALHVLPNIAAGLLAVHGWLRWAVARHGRGDGWLAASVLGYAGALGWGSKGLVVLVVVLVDAVALVVGSGVQTVLGNRAGRPCPTFWADLAHDTTTGLWFVLAFLGVTCLLAAWRRWVLVATVAVQLVAAAVLVPSLLATRADYLAVADGRKPVSQVDTGGLACDTP